MFLLDGGQARLQAVAMAGHEGLVGLDQVQQVIGVGGSSPLFGDAVQGRLDLVLGFQ